MPNGGQPPTPSLPTRGRGRAGFLGGMVVWGGCRAEARPTGWSMPGHAPAYGCAWWMRGSPQLIIPRHQPIPLYQPPHMFRHHVLQPRGVGAAEVEDGLDCFHLYPSPCEFQPARADAGMREADHGQQPVGPSGPWGHAISDAPL